MSGLLHAEAQLNALGGGPFPLPLGGLAPAVEAVFSGFGRGGWVLCGPRERVGAVLRGCPVERLADRFAGARPYRLAPVSAAPGNRALHAVGLALATREPVLCVLGLASAASGAFYEALNTAALTGAPVLFVLIRQPLGDDAPVSRQIAGDPVAVAMAVGVPAERIDVANAAALVARVRALNTPFFLEVISE